MIKESLENILNTVAENNGTSTAEVKSQLENIAQQSSVTKNLTWDELILFSACLSVYKGGYTDLSGS